MFCVGDKVVYPMHGAGVIEKIEDREILGKCQRYYIMKMPVGDMKVMIPVESTENLGLRSIVDSDLASRILDCFARYEADTSQNWNKRYRENMLRLKTGDIVEVAKVVKCLMLRDKKHGLSTGERKMLLSARQIFISEISLSLGEDAVMIEKLLESAIVDN